MKFQSGAQKCDIAILRTELDVNQNRLKRNFLSIYPESEACVAPSLSYLRYLLHLK